MTKIRFIGDVHQLYPQYFNLINDNKVDYSVALGDIGFDYHVLKSIDINKHRCLAGNHDNYDVISAYPIFLGDYGVYKCSNTSMFYIRGGYSIDRQYRTPHKSWWPQEQLNYNQTNAALKEYKQNKPYLMISHECPSEILPLIFTTVFPPSYTAKLLQSCFEYYKPNMWIFGHMHKSFRIQYKNTQFIGLNELEVYDYEE